MNRPVSHAAAALDVFLMKLDQATPEEPHQADILARDNYMRQLISQCTAILFGLSF